MVVSVLSVIILPATTPCLFIPNFYVVGSFCLNSCEEKKNPVKTLALYKATGTYQVVKCEYAWLINQH